MQLKMCLIKVLGWRRSQIPCSRWWGAERGCLAMPPSQKASLRAGRVRRARGHLTMPVMALTPASPADRPWLTESKKVQKLQDKVYMALQHEIQKKHSTEDKLSKVVELPACGTGSLARADVARWHTRHELVDVTVPELTAYVQVVLGGKSWDLLKEETLSFQGLSISVVVQVEAAVPGAALCH